MPAGSTAFAAVAAPTGPKGPVHAETSIDATVGNKFDTTGVNFLVVRNTTAGVIVLDFFADTPEGNEVKVMSKSIPGSATANGIALVGPFPLSRYGLHATTEPASNGKVIMKPFSGITGNLVACLVPNLVSG